jgi:signal transduction histidine kinase
MACRHRIGSGPQPDHLPSDRNYYVDGYKDRLPDDRSALPRYVPHAKAERLAAITRLMLAVYAVTAGVVTGMLREPGGRVAVALLAAWCILAVAVYARTRSGRATSLALGVSVPVADLVLIVIAILSSGGALSAFFPLLVQPFFAVSLLYGRRAIAWTGVVAVTAYLLVSFGTPQRRTNPRLFVMRIGFLLIIGAGAVRRSDFDTRTRTDALKLASWPQPGGLDPDDFLRTLLDRAADLLRSPRVLLAWEDLDGKSQFAFWNRGATELLDPLPDGPRAVVSRPLAGASFLSRDVSAASPEGIRFDGRGFAGYRGELLEAGFVQRFAIRAVVTVSFRSEMVEGRIFFLDGRDLDSDDLTLAEIVGRLLGGALEQASLMEKLRRTTATEERMRLSRDLHDTLLQSMAGLALHAEGARRAMASDTADAEQRLATIVEQLAEAQWTLRGFVDDLRPEPPSNGEALKSRLDRAAATIARQWGVSVTVQADERLSLPETLASDVCNLTAESLTNAARHAAATRIVAHVSRTAEEVQLAVEDDGRGFPFHGSYELSELLAQKRGPWSLKERVASLRGSMTLHSSGTGSRIEIRLPAPTESTC